MYEEPFRHPITLPFSLLFSPPFCFLHTSVFSTLRKRGGMCCRSNKLTHCQDCTIVVRYTGGNQQMQCLLSDGIQAAVGFKEGRRTPCLGHRGAVSLGSELDWWERGCMRGWSGGMLKALPLCFQKMDATLNTFHGFTSLLL